VTVLLLAFRNLRRQRRRTFFTGLMMAGGFFLLSVFIGMTEGSYATIIDFFTRDHAGHLQIHRTGYLDEPALYLTLEDWPKLSGRLSLEGAVTAFCPRLYASALVFNGPKTVGVRCTGVDPEEESRASRLSHKVTRGRYFPAIGDMDALVGDGLAKTWGSSRLHGRLGLPSADGSVATTFSRWSASSKRGSGGDSQISLRLSDAKILNSRPLP
jgi:ABC-type lipoprotein release transport system permease subunit